VPRRLIHQGRKIQVYQDEFLTPDGGIIPRDYIHHPGAVVILPILDREYVCLLRNERWVVQETLWEVPAGTLEPPEPVLDAAQRELQEETGYTAARWESLGYLFASPGVLNEKLHLFFAHELTAGPQALEADETIQPVTVRLAEAVSMCLDGQIRDAKTVAALLLWERRLRG